MRNIVTHVIFYVLLPSISHSLPLFIFFVSHALLFDVQRNVSHFKNVQLFEIHFIPKHSANMPTKFILFIFFSKTAAVILVAARSVVGPFYNIEIFRGTQHYFLCQTMHNYINEWANGKKTKLVYPEYSEHVFFSILSIGVEWHEFWVYRQHIRT